MNESFRKLAIFVSTLVGKPFAFFTALLIIISWALLGPLFNYSKTWQLFINTATTIVTLLMVFLIQNTQNRDSRALHLKLDELLKGIHGARNTLINLEDLPDSEIEKLHQEAQKLHDHYQKALDYRQKQKNKKKSS